MSRVFTVFRDTQRRREALQQEPGSPDRYCLYGLDQLQAGGVAVEHNLESSIPTWAWRAGVVANQAVRLVGMYSRSGGDFASVFTSLRRANAADVVFTTVDAVGLPVVLLKRAGLVRPPVVYTSVGLPERLVSFRGEPARRLFRGSLRCVSAIVVFSEFEAKALRQWFGAAAPRIEFLPFGVDTSYFRPLPQCTLGCDVVSIGADPHRDFELLIAVARRDPTLRVQIVTSAEHGRALRVPPNVALELDIPFAEVRNRLASARVVVLPVKENSYTGATTVLLQALSMGKPVVVSQTKALLSGYGLVDGENCRLVPPGDFEALERAVHELLADDASRRMLGARASAVAEALSWERFADSLEAIFLDAVRGATTA
jgi:glycosyltransferase involved in cell wall biosynthesis